MASSFVEQQVENAVGPKAIRALKLVGELAAKQGGGTTAENFQLLGKRALIVFGAAIVAVQVATSAIGLAVSRKAEEQRVERIVRRVLEEERQKEEAEE